MARSSTLGIVSWLLITICRGRVAGVFHNAGGRYYANGSAILYECNFGFARSYSVVSYDLLCMKVCYCLFRRHENFVFL